MGAYIRGEGKSDASFFFLGGGGGLQVNEPYNWEGGLVSGRGGLETAVYGTWRIFRVFFFFFPVSRRLY